MVRKRKVPGEPADPRGGARVGTQGKSYPNRTDLQRQPVRAAPSKEYGQRAAQERSQSVIPLPQQPPAGAAPGTPPPAPFAAVEDVPNLTDPTRRPGEPLESGLSFGPGPGPEALASRGPNDELGNQLRALYLAHPTQELRELLEEWTLG